MTTTMFILLATICSAASGLLTEGIKTWFKNAGKDYSANLAAINNFPDSKKIYIANKFTKDSIVYCNGSWICII